METHEQQAPDVKQITITYLNTLLTEGGLDLSGQMAVTEVIQMIERADEQVELRAIAASAHFFRESARLATERDVETEVEVLAPRDELKRTSFVLKTVLDAARNGGKPVEAVGMRVTQFRTQLSDRVFEKMDERELGGCDERWEVEAGDGSWHVLFVRHNDLFVLQVTEK